MRPAPARHDLQFGAVHPRHPGLLRPVQWEVEALDPAELQRLVLAAVAPYIDPSVLSARIAQEERRREQLRAFTSAWPSNRAPDRE